LGELGADQIVSANIGCITHLQSGTQTPVRHWVEALDEALSAAAETTEASEASMA
jgi:glycolate oxidase iron-sulfur subunit